MNNSVDILPLYSFFDSLRKHDFDLGMEEYYLLLNALQGGFGLESEAGLLFLCKTLWLKTKEREELFEKLFEEEFKKEKQYIFQLKDKKEKEVQEESETEGKEETAKSDETTTKEEPDREIDKAEIEKEKETVEKERITLSIEDVKTDSQKEIHKSGIESMYRHKFLLKGSYLSQDENQLKHAWRFLRKNENEGFTDELNVKDTIKKISREGILVEPVFIPRKKNKARLITMIDHDGSMVAFRQLSQTIAETSSSGGTVCNTIYYFYNIPHDRLYKNTAHTEAEKLEVVLNELEEKDSSLLIISDAGAARGRYNSERVDVTENFVDEVKRRTHRIAWINPMPEQRWKNSSAYYIKDVVPMFEATEAGLNGAVKILRGKLKANEFFLKNYL